MRTDLLLDQFDTLLTTPDDVAHLEAAVLQLAVRGKLVPQDLNDEPASTLLERMASEKAQLTKEGKIRRRTKPKPMATNEIPFEIPREWVWAQLNQIVAFDIGKTPRTKESRYWEDDGIPWVSISDLIHRGIVTDTSRKVSELAVEEVFRNPIVPKGTLLMSFKLTVGKVSILGIDAYHNEAIISIFPFGGVYQKYLLHFLPLLSLHGRTRDAIKGATLNSESLSRLLVPLPPLAEQKRIVAKVDELLAQTRALAAQLEQTDAALVPAAQAAFQSLLDAQDTTVQNEAWQRIADHFDTLTSDPRTIEALKQTVLQLAVQGKLVPQDPDDEPASVLVERIETERERLVQEGKIRKPKPLPSVEDEEIPHVLPKGWKWVRLGDLGNTQTGTTPSTKNPEYFGNDYPFIKPADISEDFIDYNNEGLSELGLENGRLIEVGSALMVCIGGSIGKVGVVDRDCSCNQQINALKPYLDLSGYLFGYFMRSPYFQNEVLSRAPKTTLPILSKGKWILIPFPLPPLAEQKRIVAKVDALLALCDALAAEVAAAEEVRGRLLQAVLGGG
ncbi:MAG: restriction endonuclease subunit S [Deltaproteobacteria bacterium]|nr:restriction endonuclease subunit S [Deltaproteobacteria bacterium]